MFSTTEQYYAELEKWLEENPTDILISTFGLYAGILDTGKDMHAIGGKYTSQTHVFLDKLHAKENLKVRLLVGVSQYKSCKGKEHCEDCYRTYGKQFTRLLEHAKKWPRFKWRFADQLHLKCVIFANMDEAGVSKMRTLGGGRNLTDSDWADISFELPAEMNEEVYRFFVEQWNENKKVTEENLTNYTVAQFQNTFGVKVDLNNTKSD